MKTQKLILALLFAAFALVSCKKDPSPEGQGSMRVHMTDAPGDFKEVNVEVVAVEIKYNDGDSVNGWITLPTNAGVYDLLTLRDSVTALIASGTALDPGKVNQMRLILGTNNTVVIDSVGTFPLTIPSGDKTGIKININQTIPIDQTLDITIDFDAAASVIKTGEGDYKLKPVIKVKDVRVL